MTEVGILFAFFALIMALWQWHPLIALAVCVLVACYATWGAILAIRITPLSAAARPIGRNAKLVIWLWPALYLAQGYKRLTGKYPKWMPPL